MDIQMELYRVFYSCAKHLSFSRAAEALFVSQSSVSQSVKNLEKQLGVGLFIRTTKKVQLTSEGASLYEHVRIAFEQIKAGEEELLSLQNLEAGTLRIGVSDTLSKYFLIPHLQTFHMAYPKIRIHIVNQPSPKSVASILSSEIDVAIVNLLEDMVNPLLSVHTLTTFKDVFIAGDAFSALKDQSLSAQDLLALPLISLEQNSTTRRFFDMVFSSLDSPLIPEIEIGSVDLIIELVRIGLGIGFVPAYTLPTHSAVFPLTLNFDYPSRAIALIYRKSDYPTAPVKKFSEIVQNHAFF